MKALRIVEPMSFTAGASAGWVGPDRLQSASPKEATVYPAGGTGYLGIDLGSARSLDTVVVGYVSRTDTIHIDMGNVGGNVYSADVPVAPTFVGAPYHFLVAIDNPLSVQFINISAPGSSSFAAGVSIGVFAAGLSFKTQWGQEWGAGRPIEDTSAVERLFGGGFGRDLGAIVGGYQWTFGDLQEIERKKLYGVARRLGSSRDVLVIEDPEAGDDLGDRIHWGIFQKLNTYERLNPKDTKWSLQIGDWG
jgi:hypothetical protein